MENSVKKITQKKIDKLIQSCNTNNPRKSLGRILSLEMPEIEIIMNEYERRPDIRFGDNLIIACELLNKIRRDYGYIFMDR